MKMNEQKQLTLFAKREKNNILSAERHPRRYESHKYWGRKPYNIVRKFISEYSQKGEWVLDPFCGSGVTVFEALSLGRNAIGYDINPIACFITKNLISRNVDILKLKNIGEQILNKVEKKFPYYDVICEKCGSKGKLINGIWESGKYIAKYFSCPKCGDRMAPTTELDIQLFESVQIPQNVWYPTDRLPNNADAKYVYELFTKRNLLALSLLLEEIKKIKDVQIKELLLYTFSSNLAFASKLIPVNPKRFKQKRNCSGIWGFKRFWIPNFHVENNVFKYFRNRLKRVIAAKIETNRLLEESKATAKIINKSSVKMEEIEDNSIDLIFTDPPFGGMVPYLNLSTLWNSWLQFKVDYKEEIIIDNEHTDLEYYNKIFQVFKECHRVLKNERYLVMAFNNKNIKVWTLLLKAVYNAGFSLQECLPAEDGEVSFTQTTKNIKGSLRGHFIYIFKKEKEPITNLFWEKDVEKIVKKVEYEITKFLEKKPRTISEIYNYIIPFMVNNHLLNEKLNDNLIEQILKKKAILISQTSTKIIEGELVTLKEYFWKLKL